MTVFLFTATVACFAFWGTAGIIPLTLLVIHTSGREFTEGDS